jgi:NAD(P)-dependent dehydrogenase (short-subunit alcohol dehydrogenase family)
MMSVKVALDPGLLYQAASKTVIITGGANGIGAATARLFNEHGASVVVADLELCRPTAERLINSFKRPDCAMFVPVDILNWAQMKDLFKHTIQRFNRIDIVVANAGIMETSSVLEPNKVDENGELQESQEAFKVIDVNIKGTLNSERLSRPTEGT